MNKPVVGQTVWILNVGNQARYCPQELKPSTVTKVGSKLFTCEGGHLYRPTQFYLKDYRQKTEYANDWNVYETEQEWEDEKAVAIISRRIWEAFEYGNNRLHLPLTKLREIERILDDESNTGNK